MDKSLCLILIALVSALMLSSYKKDEKESSKYTTLTDIDGNTYGATQIGNQVWMSENLKVTKYPNGSPIPYIKKNRAWGNLSDDNTSDAYCYYKNKANSKYGALYTYAAAIAENWAKDKEDNQGVCPDGWHLPSDAEWKELELCLGMSQTETGNIGDRGDKGAKLKATSGWDSFKTALGYSSNGSGTDNYAFAALPGGSRNYCSGPFIHEGEFGYWCSSTEKDSITVYYRSLSPDSEVFRSYSNKSGGFSIRCLRD